MLKWKVCTVYCFKMSYVINDNLLKCLYFYTGCKELKYNEKTKTKKNETSTDGKIEFIKNE